MRIRRTQAMIGVLRTLIAADAKLCGADISGASGVAPNSCYQILRRLEREGWLKGEWEDGNPHKLGRPLRYLYHFSPLGREQLEGRPVTA
jgi:hypothetical protein